MPKHRIFTSPLFQIASVYVGSDRIDIYDVLRSPYQTLESYKRLLTDEASYEAQNPQVFEPDRIVFANGVLQSRRSSVATYYEMLVHPAMFAHDGPKRVAILGIADGALVREILRHKSVEQVVLWEYNEALMNLTAEHFPEYNDCSFLTGSIQTCLDDPRVIKYKSNPMVWFADEDEETNSKFDVIILDDL